MGLGNSLQTAQGGAAGGVGGWVELGRTTLGADADSISVTGLTDKRYLMVLSNINAKTGTTVIDQTYNGDTGSNYASRRSADGSADSTFLNGTNIDVGGIDTGRSVFQVSYIANLAAKEKLTFYQTVYGSAGAANTPYRLEGAAKWVNTSNAISRIDTVNDGAGDYTSGDEMVVLGWDPADTHTSNFWEELASVDLSGGAATNIDSGTILAKKYLWIQYYTEQSVDSDFLITFNADTGSNYARRYDNDGGTETTGTSLANFTMVSRQVNIPVFMNMFIINNSANEKLIIAHQVNQVAAGATSAPTRSEYVGKWANTAAQITSMNIKSGSGNLASKTVLKIWGSD